MHLKFKKRNILGKLSCTINNNFSTYPRFNFDDILSPSTSAQCDFNWITIIYNLFFNISLLKYIL